MPARFTLSGPLFDNPNLGNQIVAEFLSIMHEILNGTAVPRMRSRIPVQTGNLKQSLRIAYSPEEGVVTIGFTPWVFTGASRAACGMISTTLPLR